MLEEVDQAWSGLCQQQWTGDVACTGAEDVAEPLQHLWRTGSAACGWGRLPATEVSHTGCENSVPTVAYACYSLSLTTSAGLVKRTCWSGWGELGGFSPLSPCSQLDLGAATLKEKLH